MLENLFNLVQEASHDAVVNNPDVPNEHNEEVIAEATNTVASGLRNMIAGGGLKSVIALFHKKNGEAKDNSENLSDNPLISMMIGHFAGKLATKYNMDEAKAKRVANNLIPGVLSNLVAKTNDSADNGFSLEKLLNSITGGKTKELVEEEQKNGKTGFSFKDLISKILGGGDDKNEGGTGLMDIITKLAGGALSQKKRNGGGGLLNIIKGFFKKR